MLLYEKQNNLKPSGFLITQICTLCHNRTQRLVTKACISMQKNRESRPSSALQMQPLFMTVLLFFHLFPGGVGLAGEGWGQWEDISRTLCPPPPTSNTTTVTNHQPHPCAINTDINTKPNQRMRLYSCLVATPVTHIITQTAVETRQHTDATPLVMNPSEDTACLHA